MLLQDNPASSHLLQTLHRLLHPNMCASSYNLLLWLRLTPFFLDILGSSSPKLLSVNCTDSSTLLLTHCFLFSLYSKASFTNLQKLDPPEPECSSPHFLSLSILPTQTRNRSPFVFYLYLLKQVPFPMYNFYRVSHHTVVYRTLNMLVPLSYPGVFSSF